VLEAEIAGGWLGLAGGVSSSRRRCVSAWDISEFVEYFGVGEWDFADSLLEGVEEVEDVLRYLIGLRERTLRTHRWGDY
jgi:hypothetical protein